MIQRIKKMTHSYLSQPLFSPDVCESILDAVKSYADWQDALSNTDIAITTEEYQACRARICFDIDEVCGPQACDEILRYLEAVSSSKNQTQARKLPKPTLIEVRNGTNLSPNQRRLRELIAQLVELSGCSNGAKLTWLDRVKRDLQITRHIHCPLCGKQGNLIIHGVQRAKFSCTCCDHRFTYPLNELVDRCGCVVCGTRRRGVLTRIRDSVKTFEPECLKAIESFNKTLQVQGQGMVSDAQMRIDYRLNENEIGKDLRAILSLEPRSAEEFMSFLEQYLEIHKGKRSNILNSALKAKVIYHTEKWVSNVINCQTIYDAIAWSTEFLIGSDGYGGRCVDMRNDPESVGDIVHTLFKEDDETVAKCLSISANNSLIFRAENLTIFLVDPKWYGSVHGIKIAARKKDGYLLNPYFVTSLPDASALKSDLDRSHNLFRSNTEKNAYARLLQQHTKCLIVPNRLVRQIVDLPMILSQLAPTESKYAWNCEVDFAIYNCDGDILFVEEVQRGDHHNTSEWIKKDTIKRKILKIAGVKVVESF